MTLEEHIADEKQRADSLIVSASKLKPDELVVRMVYERGAEEHREKAALLEELRVLRKAFDLACGKIGNYYPCCDIYDEGKDCSDRFCKDCLKEYFLQKARKENENEDNKIP